MIDCSNGDVRDALPEYVNDRLDAARRREVEAHLAGCDACRDEVVLLRALRTTLRRAPAVDAAAIAAAIPAYHVPARRGWATNWRVAAAVVAIAAGGTSIAVLRARTPSNGGADVSPYVRTAAAPRHDSIVAVAPPRSAVVHTPGRPAPAPQPVAAAATRELAMAGGSISDLSDGELSALVRELESLDGVISAEVDGAEPASLGSPEGI